MTPELERMIEEARNAPEMTAEKREAQRVSWAYGNAAIDTEGVTREMVEEASKLLREAGDGKTD